MLYLRTKERYEAVSRTRSDAPPPVVIFGLHMRESDNSFRSHLHEGSSLLGRTRFVPKGRIPAPAHPPFKWEDSAADALFVTDHMGGNWSDLNWAIRKMISYNGSGYDRLGLPSPYFWGSTTIQKPGKFVSDGHFNADAWDQQLGIGAVLIRMKEKGIPISFAP